MSVLLLSVKPALCWSNGGYSDNPSQPDYGTHDWIAQHALDYLPTQEKQYITDNLAVYLYGTELPDRSQSSGGIGDATAKHHIYYYANGSLQDASSAQRASEEYQKALTFLKNKDYVNASKEAGIMSHYIDDMGVFGHVMGAHTDWGAEDDSKHSSYENYVDYRTTSYNSSLDSYLHFDGSLTTVSASDAAKNLAYNTTFGDNGSLTCNWMNDNYDWNNATFKNRCGEELNLAVNAVADVLHTLYQDATPSRTPTPTPPTPSPSTTATPTSSPTTTLLPMNSPTPTSSSPTASSTPTTPEFPTTQILAVAMLMVLATTIIYKKTAQKDKRLALRLYLYRFAFNTVVHLVERILLEHWAVGAQAACSLSLLRSFASCTENTVSQV